MYNDYRLQLMKGMILLEKHWERTLPFIEIDNNKIIDLFAGILDRKDINKITRVTEGCRTTNYIVSSKINNIKYLLKIYYISEKNSRGEERLINLIKNDVPVQKIYKISRDLNSDNIEYVIYDYIEGKTISKYLRQSGKTISENIVKSAAHILARLHRYKFDKVGFFDENLKIEKEMMPLTMWYEICISDIVRERLGEDRIKGIFELVDKNRGVLGELDNNPRLVHGDFQGTNILIDKDTISGVIDWEFAMAGHPIADIGQFFRYEKYFDENLVEVFKNEYNKVSEYKLSDDWYKISKIRDLINLIQLLDTTEYMPKKHTEIINMIDTILKKYL